METANKLQGPTRGQTVLSAADPNTKPKTRTTGRPHTAEKTKKPGPGSGPRSPAERILADRENPTRPTEPVQTTRGTTPRLVSHLAACFGRKNYDFSFSRVQKKTAKIRDTSVAQTETKPAVQRRTWQKPAPCKVGFVVGVSAECISTHILIWNQVAPIAKVGQTPAGLPPSPGTFLALRPLAMEHSQTHPCAQVFSRSQLNQWP